MFVYKETNHHIIQVQYHSRKSRKTHTSSGEVFILALRSNDNIFSFLLSAGHYSEHFKYFVFLNLGLETLSKLPCLS